MILLNNLTIKKSIDKAYLKTNPVRNEFENFKIHLSKLLALINEKESEEHNKILVRDFLINAFYSDKYINTNGRTDLAIHLDKTSKSSVGVIIEAKSLSEKYDMISEDNLNCKAMHEVILYYLRERIENGNDEIKNIIITNAYKWFIFKAEQFERHFYKNKLKTDYEKWRDDQKVSKLNDHFYNEIVKKFLNETNAEIEAVFFDIRDFKKYLNKNDEKHIIPLFKKLSPPELLKEPFTNDSNTLNKQFYTELLHIIGLEEYKDGSKKKISRKDKNKRDNGSLLENTIRMLKAKDVIKNLDDISGYGSTEEDQLFHIALELNIIWINRILFLKLLEAQIVNYHRGDKNYKFLEPKIISQYDDLFELFHEVLAVKNNERNSDLVGKFSKIPYLNSSLFELSELEKKTINISELKDRFNLPFHKHTVFDKDIKSKGELPALTYLLLFLDKYDFASEGGEEFLEEHKSIINASVLGLIFEKINGYKEGSFYTPGFITMYMARETLRRAVVQKFNEAKGSEYKDYEELRKNIDTTSKGREEANNIINGLKICDPAVGSGHFLVSCLNEIIAIKADLRILNFRDGRPVQNYSFEIENDELVIINEETDDLFYYHLNPSGKPITTLQEMQETLFHEKETIIENCLFGVDINSNSVNICRLRLWIELLKNSYYTKESNYTELETLPNIDINIKQGNSLISRFDVRQDIFTHADKRILDVYKINVALYKNENDKNKRRELKSSIEKTKERFSGIAVDPLYKEKEQLEKLTEQLHELNVDNPLFKHEDSAEKEAEVEKKRNNITAKINKLTKEIEEKVEEYKAIYSNAFEWRFEFPEILDDDGNFIGFDVVIGNPPYIRGDELRNYKNYLQDTYSVYNSTADIYTYFFELGTKIAGPKGFLCLITSNKFVRSNYGKNLRHYLSDFRFNKIIDFGELPVFEEASTFPMITLFTKNNFNKEPFIYAQINNLKFISLNKIISSSKIELAQDSFNKENWLLLRKEEKNLINKLNTGNIKLINYVDGKIKFGIKTGFNEAYILNQNEYETIVNKDKKSIEIIKPFIDGNDVRKYYVDFKYKYIILAHIGLDIKKYPAIFEHLLKYKEKLENRSDKGNHWYELRPCSYYNIFETPKILYPDIALESRFTFDTKKFYPNATLFIIPTNDLYLLGLLNSKLIWFYLSKVCPVIGSETKRGRLRLKTVYLSNLPIRVNNMFKSRIESLVKNILKMKDKKITIETKQIESEIDQIVYKLYGLTEEEIKIVEGGR